MEESKKEINYSIKVADSFLMRLKGLMFRRDPLVEEGLWITPCNSIHMFFMKFAIDAVFINKDGRIIKKVENLQPWKVIKPVPEAYSVVELPAGAARKLKLEKGDFITFNSFLKKKAE
ncbi:hypothetical protein WQ57_18370 [Mesobacillus campisalis]|uniref:DUF192 domain-containing protein n=1 Tax=Mesobacillus campisalis TaxID=1408103 RepID=A0A0M2SVF6_9BACI|nr:DUF192 domain-containing protein [Mesobacillus campisalis]KKK36615.1 hypothetical protein WQ57_18370 [Mesobacillus campisalis]